MTFVEVLRQHASERPEALALRFLEARADVEATLTFGQLDERARVIAAALRQDLAPGDRAVLLYAPGLEFVAGFFGCLYAGVVAVPAYPPTPRTLDRLLSIIDNSGARLGLTTADIGEQIAALDPGNPRPCGLRWAATDLLDRGLADDWRDPRVDARALAFLQYTSGSTGTPKGVMLSHANLLCNERSIAERFEHSLETSVVTWLPPYHDMGLIGCILQPLYLGVSTTMMSPVTFLRRPARWLQAISKYRATGSGGPNFSYEMCVEKVKPEQCEGLDLSSWTLAFAGAEPTRPETLERFVARFAPHGFRREALYPCYGLAESTLFTLGGRKSDPPIVRSFVSADLERGRALEAPAGASGARGFVSAGRLGLGERVEIVDPETLVPCAPGQVGEIWVQGPSVAQGYWERPELTLEVFGARTAGGEGPFLRTGDLGVTLDGELFITGRIKDVIIVDGRNHYPQDIELTVERSHAAIRPTCSVAFGLGFQPERVAVVCELADARAPTDVVLRSILAAVSAEHGLQISEIRLIGRGGVPKTTSGKLRRSATREALVGGALDVVAAWSVNDVG